MNRNIKTFICDECNHKFVATDIEYMATSMSVPQQCPKCGSMHTMPDYSVGSKLVNNKKMADAIDKVGMEATKAVYKSIWRLTDLRKTNNK